MRRRLLLPVLLLASLAPMPAHAAQPTAMLLQGSVAFDCYGCASTATFQGVATYVRDGALVSSPVTGSLETVESCTATGSASGTFEMGGDGYSIWWSRAAAATTVSVFGPGGFYEPLVGAGTLAFDAPPTACGMPLTATLTVPLLPFVNCACVIM